MEGERWSHIVFKEYYESRMKLCGALQQSGTTLLVKPAGGREKERKALQVHKHGGLKPEYWHEQLCPLLSAPSTCEASPWPPVTPVGPLSMSLSSSSPALSCFQTSFASPPLPSSSAEYNGPPFHQHPQHHPSCRVYHWSSQIYHHCRQEKGSKHAIDSVDGGMIRLCSLSAVADKHARLCCLGFMGGKKTEAREGVAIRVHLRNGGMCTGSCSCGTVKVRMKVAGAA
eukprot:5886550-Pleurochrysis_carterae.AAC.2